MAATAVAIAVSFPTPSAANATTITASPSSSVSSPLVLTPSDGTGLTITFTNAGTRKTRVLSATLTGTGYSKVADGCSGVALARHKSCSVTISYPGDAPATQRDASLTVRAKSGAPVATAFFTVLPSAADLAITKSVDNATPNVGDQITFTLALVNNGPSTATSVRAVDLLPAGLTFVSATPSQGAYDAVTGLWAAGTVGTTGPSPTLTITTTVDSDASQTNTATISGDQFDPDGANNSASVTVTPQTAADLAITQTADNATPSRGDQITFTLTLTNNGPSAATRVRGLFAQRDGLTFVSANPSQGSYDPATGVWTVTSIFPLGSLAAGASATLTVTVTFDARNPIHTQAAAASDDQFDPNPLDNNAFLTITPLGADLAITQTVDNPSPNRGDQITFTLTLTNNGPNAASRVRAVDQLPAGLTFVSANPSQGTYDPATGVWTVTSIFPLGSLAAGASATLTITATVDSSDPVVNGVSAGSDDQFDPDPLDNSAFVTVTPRSASG